MKTLVLLFLFITFNSYSQSKIKISGPNGRKVTVQSIVKTLEGEGIIVQNITSNQSDSTNQIGSFYDKRFTLSMNKGILMSTGSVKNITKGNQFAGMTGVTAGKNNSDKASYLKYWQNSNVGDNDLAAVLDNSYKLYDACVIEMDIIPLGDTLSFRYLFASEEYDEYVCSAFNDAFAFFISGEGIEGKRNMAVLQNGDRISINSVNNGNPSSPNCVKQNPSFYNKNNGQIPLEYDGFTRTLEIIQPVKAFTTYHLKLVIADASDNAFDSGVFIESKSVISYNKKYVIPFNSTDYQLTKKNKNILDALMTITENHPEFKLEIAGHTDNEGSESYNLALSQHRIDKVVDYITSQGFYENNIMEINRGESMPTATNETSVGKQLNRRVEIKLIPSLTASTQQEEIITSSDCSIESINPNPSMNYATIQLNNFDATKNLKLVVYSLTGELIKSELIAAKHTKIDVSQWKAGLYSAMLYSSNSIISNKKFVVVK